jgi:hypothetical protein
MNSYQRFKSRSDKYGLSPRDECTHKVPIEIIIAAPTEAEIDNPTITDTIIKTIKAATSYRGSVVGATAVSEGLTQSPRRENDIA